MRYLLLCALGPGLAFLIAVTCLGEGTVLTVRAPSGNRLWVDGASTSGTPDGSLADPFPTIQQGLDAASPGHIVTVRAGTYRENLILPSGAPGQPLTLAAMSGERVMINPMSPVTNWQPHAGSIFTTAINWVTKRLYVDFDRQTLAREPSEGWWAATAVDNNAVGGVVSLTDTVNLTGFTNDLTGASAYIWTQSGNQFFLCPIVSLDQGTGRLRIQRTNGAMVLTAGDKYWLENQVSLIDRLGEWATIPDGPSYRLYFQPSDTNDLARTQVTLLSGRAVRGYQVQNVRLENLDVAGAADHGIYFQESQDVEISGCLVHDNVNYGIYIKDVDDSRVAHSVVFRNEHGVVYNNSTSVTVEENEIAWNNVDGLLLTSGSSNLVVRRNYIHDHLLWGHPDNAQMYFTVTDVHYIENLFITGGQTVMMQDTTQGEFTGNTFIGSSANMIIFGHGTAGYYSVRNNTFACAGYQCMNLTWRDYDVKENVFMNGNGSVLYGVAGVTNYDGDTNLFWNGQRLVNPQILASDGGWHTSLAAFQADTGEDLNSVHGDPRFVNAPIAYNVMDDAQLTQSTEGTLYLRDLNTFQVGDFISLNFEDTARTVTAVSGSSITIQPPLDEKPMKSWLVANWGTNNNVNLDLALQPSSPGYALGSGGAPVGSSISISSYKAGDFDGDGRRDLPEIPADIDL